TNSTSAATRSRPRGTERTMPGKTFRRGNTAPTVLSSAISKSKAWDFSLTIGSARRRDRVFRASGRWRCGMKIYCSRSIWFRPASLGTTNSVSCGQTVSEWMVDFEKSIVAHSHFSVVDCNPVTTPAEENIPDKVKLKLQANPLLNDDRVTIEMMIGLDGDGSF